jgi:fructose-1,6-bisphosphatase II / sedoheptulose-1,7-bisphosphatase
MTEQGGFLHAPDLYMEKIAIGFDFKEQLIDLANSPAENLRNVAAASGKNVSDLIITVLKRERNEELIAKLREQGARVRLINDGDIAAVIETAFGKSDIYMGSGGAPEGVLAAAALNATGGQFCGKLLFRNDEERLRAAEKNITDLNKHYYLHDLAYGDVVFAASGVTDGSLIDGIKISNGRITVQTLTMIAASKEIRRISSSTPMSR